MYNVHHKKGYIPVVTVLPNQRLVLTVSSFGTCVLNGLYGPDGWFCADTVTLRLFELLGLGWYMYITVLSIELLGLLGSDCQDWSGLSRLVSTIY